MIDVKAMPSDAFLALCAPCPVREECLQFALAQADLAGVWVGRDDRAQAARDAAAVGIGQNTALCPPHHPYIIPTNGLLLHAQRGMRSLSSEVNATSRAVPRPDTGTWLIRAYRPAHRHFLVRTSTAHVMTQG